MLPSATVLATFFVWRAIGKTRMLLVRSIWFSCKWRYSTTPVVATLVKYRPQTTGVRPNRSVANSIKLRPSIWVVTSDALSAPGIPCAIDNLPITDDGLSERQIYNPCRKSDVNFCTFSDVSEFLITCGQR